MPIIDVRDTFDGGSGSIIGRTSDVGRTGEPEYAWGTVAGHTSPPFQEVGGYIVGTGIGNWSPHVVGNPRSPNYKVVAEVEAVLNADAGVIARALDGPAYYILYQVSNGHCFMERVFGPAYGDKAFLGSTSVVASGIVTLELEVAGPRITGWRNGVQIASVTDGTLSAKGRPGIAGATGGAGEARIHSFEVVDLVNPIRVWS